MLAGKELDLEITEVELDEDIIDENEIPDVVIEYAI